MSSTHEGGIKARDTNYKRQGLDFYQRIGRKGGKSRNPKKGFGSNPELARIAGEKGWKIRCSKTEI